jgi:TonB family protein
MQKAVALIFALATAAADPALACKELEKDQATTAAYLLQRQTYVVKRCVTCPEERRELMKVATVTTSPAPAQRWTVTLNGAPVDIEELYLRIDPAIAVSLAHLVGCQMPSDLPAQVSMKADATTAREVAALPAGLTPQKVHNVDPEYPALARQARIQGKVVLDAVIEKDGSVTNVRVVESPHPMLDEPAIVAVQRWRYKPILVGGAPIRARVTVTTTFGLK